MVRFAISFKREAAAFCIGYDKVDELAATWPLGHADKVIDGRDSVVQLALKVRHEHALARLQSGFDRTYLPVIVGAILGFNALKILETSNPLLDLLTVHGNRGKRGFTRTRALGRLKALSCLRDKSDNLRWIWKSLHGGNPNHLPPSTCEKTMLINSGLTCDWRTSVDLGIDKDRHTSAGICSHKQIDPYTACDEALLNMKARITQNLSNSLTRFTAWSTVSPLLDIRQQCLRSLAVHQIWTDVARANREFADGGTDEVNRLVAGPR